MTRSSISRYFPTFVGFWPRLRSLRRPRLRHKARWAAFGLLIVALAIGWVLVRRHLDGISLARRLRAEACFRRAYDAQQEANTWADRLDQLDGPADDRTFDAYARAVRRRSYFHMLTVKYYMAANRPWLSVPPDPPPPE